MAGVGARPLDIVFTCAAGPFIFTLRYRLECARLLGGNLAGVFKGNVGNIAIGKMCGAVGFVRDVLTDDLLLPNYSDPEVSKARRTATRF